MTMTVGELIEYLEESDYDGDVRLITINGKVARVTSFTVHDRIDFAIIQGDSTPTDPENTVYLIEGDDLGDVPKDIQAHMYAQ